VLPAVAPEFHGIASVLTMERIGSDARKARICKMGKRPKPGSALYIQTLKISTRRTHSADT
jgi:hypothetical protein